MMPMNDLPRQTLCQLMSEYGHDLIKEPRRVRAMLHDLCPQYRREVNVLTYAMEEQIPNSLLNASIALRTEILHANLSKRLSETLALSEKAAKWAVESWASALSTEASKKTAVARSNSKQAPPSIQPSSLIEKLRKRPHSPTSQLPSLPPPPSKAPLTVQKATWTKLSPIIRLPSLQKNGMMQRLGRGRIYEVIVLQHQANSEPRLLVVAGGGAILFDQNHQPLWEIDCPASCAALSHNEELLALGCKSSIYLWDIKSGCLLERLEAHSHWINSISFSKNGKILASAGRDIKIWLWDVATRKPLHYLSGHTKAINSLAFSPNSEMLVSGSDDQSVRLWSLQEELYSLQKHTKEVNHVGFSPGGEFILSASNDGTIRLWDAKDARQLLCLNNAQGAVRYATFSPNGHLLAFVDHASHQIKLWHITNKRHLPHLEGHSLLLESISFTPDSQWLISGSLDKTVRLWDLRDGYEKRRIEAHSKSVQSIIFSRDGSLLASLYHAEASIHLWDIDQERELEELKGHKGFVRSIAFHPHQPLLASAGSDNTLRLWDINRHIEVNRLNEIGQITQITFNPAGSTLAFVNQEATLYLWDLSNLAHLGTNSIDATSTPKSDLKELKGHHKALTSLAFSPDGKLLASASRDGTICLWKMPGEHEAFRLTLKDRSYAEQLVFSPDNRLLAAIESDTNMICLWDLTTQEQLNPLIGHTARITSLAFSPTRALIASASVDGTIRLWNPDTAREERRLEGHADYATSLAFNPKEGSLATASLDGTIRVWRVG